MGWWDFQKCFYLRWQGLYITTAVMCSPLNPMIHSRFDLYWLSCWLGIGSLLLSLGALMCHLTCNWLATMVLLCAYLILFLYQILNPAKVLLWLNAKWAYKGKGYNLNRIGGAPLFDQQQNKWYQLMRAPDYAGVVLDSLSATPPTIFLTGLSPDTAHFTNKVYAMFFEKQYVRVNKKAS